MVANVGRGGEGGVSHDIALQRAWVTGTDVVLLQEPWTRSRDDVWFTKSHPGFDLHLPTSTLGRPRAATYVRRGLASQQIRPSGEQTDYVWVLAAGLTFVNVYRAPHTGLVPLFDWIPSGPAVIAGDFNAVDRLWQPQAQRTHGDGASIKRWMLSHDLALCSIPGEATHRAGNTGPRLVECRRGGFGQCG